MVGGVGSDEGGVGSGVNKPGQETGFGNEGVAPPSVLVTPRLTPHSTFLPLPLVLSLLPSFLLLVHSFSLTSSSPLPLPLASHFSSSYLSCLLPVFPLASSLPLASLPLASLFPIHYHFPLYHYLKSSSVSSLAPPRPNHPRPSTHASCHLEQMGPGDERRRRRREDKGKKRTGCRGHDRRRRVELGRGRGTGGRTF